jgi:hypothetical protein
MPLSAGGSWPQAAMLVTVNSIANSAFAFACEKANEFIIWYSLGCLTVWVKAPGYCGSADPTELP